MTSRRRLLQIIASSFKWIAHSFTNLYYSLIPTIISGKKVQDKAKVVRVYGNSEVKNQLVPVLFDTVQQSVTFTTSNNGRKVVLSGTSSGYFTYTLSFGTTLPANSVVLVSIKVKNPNNVFFGYRLRQNNITPMDYTGSTYIQVRTTTSAIDCIQFYGDPNIDYTGVEIEDVQLVYLTQRYPFNTPTTLTDPRVQKILNGGYEEYNLGEIVDVDMGEIDSEPYNLFDGNLEIGNLSGGTSVWNCHTTNYIKVYGGATLTFENGNLATNQSNGFYYREYDENFNQVGSQQVIYGALNTADRRSNFTVSNKTRYVKFFLYIDGYNFTNNMPTQLSVHITGTRTGYADHNDFVDLANFKPTDVMGIKDTFLANSVGYKITKKTASYTFTGNEVFVDFDGAGYSMTIVINGMKAPATANDVPNASWDLGTTIARNAMSRDKPEYTISVNTSGRLFIITTKTSSQLASALVGKTITYELATYQTINVPLRHLGMYTFSGNETWTETEQGRAYCTSIQATSKYPSSQTTMPNIYMSDYSTVVPNDALSGTTKNMVCSLNVSGAFIVVDKSIASGNFASAMAGKTIYFETADVIDETGIIIDKGNLSLSYQGAGVGTAHDTMEQTDTEWVFTKAMNEYTFTGGETWAAEGQQYYTSLPIEEYIKGVPTNTVGNIICCCLTSVNQSALNLGTADNGIAVGYLAQTKVITVRSSTNITSPQTASSYMAGKTIKFQLATPQLIRIPRKHLGVVKIKDLSWSKLPYGFATRSAISSAKTPANNGVQGNIYCSKYLTVSRNAIGYSSPWNTIGIAIQQDGVVCISDYANLDSLTESDFLAKYGNLIIFYETEDEVADIDLTILVEAGGTLTSNWFSWVRNQLVVVKNSGSSNNFIYTKVNDQTMSISCDNSQGSTLVDFYPCGSNDYLIKGHKYLYTWFKKINGVGVIICYDGSTYRTANPNSVVGMFVTITTDTVRIGQLGGMRVYAGGTMPEQTISFNLIDLTQGFGAGKEPTDINDHVIKEILRLGYIPTDVSGTLTNVDSKVLPDIDCKIKCK